MAGLLNRERLPIDVLDEAVPDRPVIILDDLGHGGWANTLAMEAVGYDKVDAHPPGGILDREAATGRLSGVVLENAQQPLRTASFEPNAENLELAYQGLLRALGELAQNGITTVSDAGGYWPRGHHTVWQRAEEEGTLTVRASNALYLFPDFPVDEQMKSLQAYYTNDPEKLVRFNQVKIYVDGILSQGTGALFEPYLASYGLPNIPEDGFLYFDVETLNRYLTELDAAGFQANIHTTGDRGTSLALDAIEQATQTNGSSDKRHRITHLYMIDPSDRPRFNELNVVADFQLAPSSVDPDYLEDQTEYLGDRAYDLLPAFEMLEAGATVAISSDWDADTLSPFTKIQSIREQDKENVPDLDTIIRLMTLNVAYLLHHEDKTGSLEVGKLADLIVLDQNLFELSVGQIEKTTVLLTFLEGEEIYREPSFEAGLE
jgi:predicted amidohydrolase YtcJ